MALTYLISPNKMFLKWLIQDLSNVSEIERVSLPHLQNWRVAPSLARSEKLLKTMSDEDSELIQTSFFSVQFESVTNANDHYLFVCPAVELYLLMEWSENKAVSAAQIAKILQSWSDSAKAITGFVLTYRQQSSVLVGGADTYCKIRTSTLNTLIVSPTGEKNHNKQPELPLVNEYVALLPTLKRLVGANRQLTKVSNDLYAVSDLVQDNIADPLLAKTADLPAKEIEQLLDIFSQHLTTNNALIAQVNDLNEKLSHAEADGELSLLQINQLQEELESLYLDNNDLKTKLAEKDDTLATLAQNELMVENELLTLQVNQLQEELEHYFMKWSEAQNNSSLMLVDKNDKKLTLQLVSRLLQKQTV